MSGNSQRTYWLKTLHQWHWISAALALTGIVLFSITGFTLNHAAQLGSNQTISSHHATLPTELRIELAAMSKTHAATQAATPLPVGLQDWLNINLHIDSSRFSAANAEWSDQEIYVSLPRPGGDAWVNINFENGAVEHQDTDRGWLAYFNDLHKGRHTGAAWSWFIDLMALACLVFATTGLLILKLHAANRPNTWPLVGFGLLLPVLLAILFIH